MARTIGKLTALKINRLSQPGMYADGGGLYLQVTSAAGKSWVFRYLRAGRSREMGLGSLGKVPLAKARAAADECCKALGGGLDPIAERDAAREREALEAAKAITFSEAAERYIAANGGMRSTLRNGVRPSPATPRQCSAIWQYRRWYGSCAGCV